LPPFDCQRARSLRIIFSVGFAVYGRCSTASALSLYRMDFGLSSSSNVPLPFVFAFLSSIFV
jgi:hypothetical protein